MYNIFEGAAGNRVAKWFQIFIVMMIMANVLMVILEAEIEIKNTYEDLFRAFEVFSIVVFTAEYVGRVAVCVADPRYRHSWLGRLRFMVTPMMLIDLAAILPFFLPFIAADVRFIRIIRLLKLTRYSESMQTLGRVFRTRKGDLYIAFFVLFIVWIFSSTLMYHAERLAQPEKFGTILGSMWWGVITLTTIGYGDTYPITDVGKALGTVIALLGIAFYAIPIGIIASAFTEEMRKKRPKKHKCPRCGEDVPCQ